MHFFELSSPGSNALSNFFHVFLQVCSSPYSHILHFTWFTCFLTLLQHCNMPNIHVSLRFFYSHISLLCCLLGHVFTLHYITGFPLTACNSHSWQLFQSLQLSLSGSFENILLHAVDPSRVIWWSGLYQTSERFVGQSAFQELLLPTVTVCYLAYQIKCSEMCVACGMYVRDCTCIQILPGETLKRSDHLDAQTRMAELY